MARLLTAGAAGNTSAADRFGDRLAAGGVWLLGCLAAAAAVVGRGAEQFCSPSAFSTAVPHSLLSGWTPCVVSLSLTSVPSIVTLMASAYCARNLRRDRTVLAGGRPAKVQSSEPAAHWHRLTMVMALVAFISLRFANMSANAEGISGVTIWQFTDLCLFSWVWAELVLSVLDRGMCFPACLLLEAPKQTSSVAPGRRPCQAPLGMVAVLAAADVIKTMLTARLPWQPVTDANKMLPSVGGLYASSIFLELYILMGVALYYRLAVKAVAAHNCAIKEPLLAADDTAIADDAGNELAAGLGAIKAGTAEP